MNEVDAIKEVLARHRECFIDHCLACERRDEEVAREIISALGLAPDVRADA